ncbi:hypothetical protein B0H15DRAFT_948447 [Mycena belliarum]|uniref:Uncharacterized protein n=1 Tax=Mycena belliarum TaxID=1033014 RepID=A0AAD6XVW0_9AGAR|nr:hypothetical protein B0H15DRAFT_948447 [Mycena belliae]
MKVIIPRFSLLESLGGSPPPAATDKDKRAPPYGCCLSLLLPSFSAPPPRRRRRIVPVAASRDVAVVCDDNDFFLPPVTTCERLPWLLRLVTGPGPSSLACRRAPPLYWQPTGNGSASHLGPSRRSAIEGLHAARRGRDLGGLHTGGPELCPTFLRSSAFDMETIACTFYCRYKSPQLSTDPHSRTLGGTPSSAALLPHSSPESDATPCACSRRSASRGSVSLCVEALLLASAAPAAAASSRDKTRGSSLLGRFLPPSRAQRKQLLHGTGIRSGMKSGWAAVAGHESDGLACGKARCCFVQHASVLAQRGALRGIVGPRARSGHPPRTAHPSTRPRQEPERTNTPARQRKHGDQRALYAQAREALHMGVIASALRRGQDHRAGGQPASPWFSRASLVGGEVLDEVDEALLVPRSMRAGTRGQSGVLLRKTTALEPGRAAWAFAALRRRLRVPRGLAGPIGVLAQGAVSVGHARHVYRRVTPADTGD